MDAIEQAPQRASWIIEQIRATDLRDGDVLLLNGVWREVVGVWSDETDAREDLGDCSLAQDAAQALGRADGCSYRAVALMDYEASTEGSPEWKVCALLWCDLVSVQKEVPGERSAPQVTSSAERPAALRLSRLARPAFGGAK
ncbi:hypothetical protein [Streptomyces sp. NPDC087294]|uniref:hypothetical protein n=1 Tax=Streptomyces sp. NPDC087294 TaxID=3365777 RepID=UPI0037FD3354